MLPLSSFVICDFRLWKVLSVSYNTWAHYWHGTGLFSDIFVWKVKMKGVSVSNEHALSFPASIISDNTCLYKSKNFLLAQVFFCCYILWDHSPEAHAFVASFLKIVCICICLEHIICLFWIGYSYLVTSLSCIWSFHRQNISVNNTISWFTS